MSTRQFDYNPYGEQKTEWYVGSDKEKQGYRIYRATPYGEEIIAYGVTHRAAEMIYMALHNHTNKQDNSGE